MTRACNTEWTSVCGSLTSATRQWTSMSHHLSTPHDFASFAVLLVVKFRDTNCVLAPRRAPAKKRPGNGATPTKLTPRTHAHAWIRAGAEAGKGRVLSARAHVCDLLSLAVFFLRGAAASEPRNLPTLHASGRTTPAHTLANDVPCRAALHMPRPTRSPQRILDFAPRGVVLVAPVAAADIASPPSHAPPWRLWWADH